MNPMEYKDIYNHRDKKEEERRRRARRRGMYYVEVVDDDNLQKILDSSNLYNRMN